MNKKYLTILLGICFIVLVGGIAWDISTSYYIQSFSVSSQATNPTGVTFNSDGTKMYIIGYTSDAVHEYNLGTGWDISTAVWLQSFSIASQDTQSFDVTFSPDGTKMYITGWGSTSIYKYNLGTGWDISTASYIQSFSVSSQETNLAGVTFNSDGTKMYIIGYTSDAVHEYNLGTGWDISTAVWLQSFSVSSQETSPEDVTFSPDGTKMYIVGDAVDKVHRYNLGTAWNISTASYSQAFYVGSQEANTNGLALNTNGTRMYTIGWNSDAVHEYHLNALPSTTTPIINPTIAYAYTNLNCSTTYSDSELDLGVVYFEWFKNDISIITDSQSSITSGTLIYDILTIGNFSENDNIVCNIYSNDGYRNETKQNSTIKIITTSLNITLESPENNSYSPATKTFNCSATDKEGLSNITFYFWNSTGDLNLSTTLDLTGTSNSTTYEMTFNSTGIWTWRCSAFNNNSREWWADDNFTINVDIDNPQIEISYPEDTNYSTAPTQLNYTYTETNCENVWYSNDTGTTNYSVQSCGDNFTGMVTIEGENNWTVYINDSSGNENLSSISFRFDGTNPNATLYSPENNTYLDSSSNNFTSNLTDNLGLKNVTIYIYNSLNSLVNQTTYIIADATSYTWGIVVDLSDDVYTWFVTTFDSADNSDTTENQTFTIDTTFPLISLIYPTATNYTSVQTQLNFTRSDTNLAGCWYSLDEGVTNSSYDSSCLNISELNSGQGSSTWIIYINDSAGNENSSSVTFFVDSINPVVNIIDPKAQTYSYNESLPLNYTITDTNKESCWYKVTNSSSDIIINNLTTDCLNTTFNVPRSDTYTITLYSNDTLGNEGLDSVIFEVSLASPSIVLEYPTDNLWLTIKENVYFNFTATDTNGLDVCELWTNSTGTWHKNVTFNGVVSGTQNFTQINLVEGNGYIWNVWCNDTTGLDDWALNNFTFNVDTINPLIEYTTGTENNNTNHSRDYIFVNVTASDTNEANIVFRLYNQTSEVNSTILTSGEREFNFTNLPDEIYTYNVTITDDSGRSNSTETRTIRLDDTAPTLAIDTPNAQNYADNNTIELNYTVSDNLIGLDECWYYVQNSTGSTIISTTTLTTCQNTTFGLPSGDIDYTVYVFSRDILLNTNVDSVTFGIRTESPAVVLTPTNNTHVNNGTELYFNFTVDTNADSILNCSLYGDFNGTWLYNQTILIPIEGVNTNFLNISLSEGDYTWNTLCYDDLSNNGWALNNLSFTVDLTYPSVSFDASVTTTADSKSITFWHTTTDTNIDTCKYSIFDSTGGIDGSNLNKSFTCGTLSSVSATVTDYATYNLTIYATDKALNENSTTISFTTSESTPATGGGGGATTATTEDLGFCGDGVCNESRGETFFNCPEDCSQDFKFPDLDAMIFNCFDEDETTECVWSTNPGLFLVLAFMLSLLVFTILFEFKPEAKGIKKWIVKKKFKRSKWRK